MAMNLGFLVGSVRAYIDMNELARLEMLLVEIRRWLVADVAQFALDARLAEVHFAFEILRQTSDRLLRCHLFDAVGLNVNEAFVLNS